MSQVRRSKYHAVFPPGYRDPWWSRLVFLLGIHSERVRRFFYEELAPSRFRMALVSAFMRQVWGEFAKGRLKRNVDAIVREGAELEMFFLGEFRGRDGWVRAFEHWFESFPNLKAEVREFIDPPGDRLCVVIDMTGEAGKEAIPVQSTLYFVMTTQETAATAGRFYEDRGEALAAAGLSE